MNTGVKISGAAHLGLILWMTFGGLFSFERDDPLEVSDVTLISGEQFAAMMAAGNQAPDVAQAPETPVVVQEEAEAPSVPEPEAAPDPADAPGAVETATPESTPQVEETFETPRADVSPVAPVAPALPDTSAGASSVLAPENPPAPAAAPRVAPRPVERPDADANISEEIQQAARREDSPTAPPVPDIPEETTAPEEAGTVIETEATAEAGGTALSELAPLGTPRPQRRPNRPPPTPEPEPESEPSSDPLADAIAGAVAEAATETAAAGSARSGPPLTSGEKDALRLGVQQCWNVGSLSTDALNTVVTVYFEMDQTARPVASSIRMLESEGGSPAAANQAFEAARRAIIRCGASGYGMPPEKYDQWREVEVVFNPDYMRVR